MAGRLHLVCGKMMGLADAAAAPHVLHPLDVPDETCRARLRRRNAEGGHDFAASDAQFDQITSYFQAPAEDEGLNVATAAPGNDLQSNRCPHKMGSAEERLGSGP